ncbi:MAG: Ig-like domain repeat protein, partial [bacterium]
MKTLLFGLLLAALAMPVAAATRTWNGSASTLWSNSLNWDSGAPSAGDDLVFPSGASNVASVNDLAPGLLIHSIAINSNGYHISGNAIVLDDGGITVNNHFLVSLISGTLNFANVTLNASQTWSGFEHAESVALGPVNMNGKSLTIAGGTYSIPSMSGSGTIVVSGSGGLSTSNSSYTGPVTVNSGLLILNGTSGNAQVKGGQLILSGGSAGNIDVNGGTLDVQEFLSGTPSHSGSVTFNGGDARIETTQFNVVVDNVTGTVALNNAAFSLNTSAPPPAGLVMTLFNNDGTDPVIGTFRGLPEGAIFNMGSSIRISYMGGTGNDVTLTVLDNFVPDTQTTLASSKNPSLAGDLVTLTAIVTTSLGSVAFYDGAPLLGVVPLDASGRAALTIPFGIGMHAITAAYT